MPIRANFPNVRAISTTWALIQFAVSFISYTPEKYRVKYNIINEEEQLFSPMFSEILEGSQNITSQNSYVISLPTLELGTSYNYTIASTNDNFSTIVYSSPQVFSTLQAGMLL